MKKYSLLMLKPKQMIFSLVFFIIVIFVFVLILFKVKTFDSVATVGLIDCDSLCHIKVSMTYESVGIFNNNPFIFYNNKSYDIWNITYSEPYFSDGLVIQDIEFDTNLSTENNLINIKILSNRQRMIDKLKKFIER